MNNIVIKGRLTADPEMRKTTNGVPVANFTVAVDRTFNRDETDFFRCTAWRSTAEFVNEHFKKGQEILLRRNALRCLGGRRRRKAFGVDATGIECRILRKQATVC